MQQVVRAFLFNQEGKVLMTKHRPDTLWVLPGGHREENEGIHEALIREIREEFGIGAVFFDIDADEALFHKGKKLHQYPLPIAIYDLHYSDREGRDKSRREYIFLMETSDTIEKTQCEEIYRYSWFDVDDILTMEPNKETYDFIIQMLEKIVGEEIDK